MQTSGYKVKNKLMMSLFVVLVLIITTQNIFAQTDYYSQGTGNFGTLTNWDPNRGGGGTDPTAIDNNGNFIIQPGHTITNDGTYTINSLTVEDDATTGGAYVHNSNTLTLEGNLTVEAALANNGDLGSGANITFAGTADQTIDLSGDGTFGNLTLNNTGTSADVDDIVLSADIYVEGNITITDGDFQPGNHAITLEGDISIGANGTITSGTSTFVFPHNSARVISSENSTVGFYNIIHNPNLTGANTLAFQDGGTADPIFTINGYLERQGRSASVIQAADGCTLTYGGSGQLRYSSLNVDMTVGDEWPATASTGTPPNTVQVNTSRVINVAKTTSVNNVIIQNGGELDVNLTVGNLTINNQLTLTDGALDNNGTLAYSNGATLQYNGSVQQTVGDEWATGVVPTNVTVNNSTSTNPALVLGSTTLPSLTGNLRLLDGSVDYNASGQSLSIAGNVIGGGGTFGTGTNTATLIITGANSQVTSSGATDFHDVTFNSAVTNGSLSQVNILGTLVLAASSNVILNNPITASAITINGTLRLGGKSISGNPTFTFGPGGVLETNGASLSGYSIFDNDQGLVIFNGTQSSNIIPQLTFWDLEINNSDGVDVSTYSPIVQNELTLTSGILTTTSGLITAASVTTGGTFGPTLHVNGPLAISGTSSKTFPIGKDGIYKPITVTGTTNTTRFELFNSDPSGTPFTPLTVISTIRYWQGTGNISSGSITLPYDGNDGVSVPGDLRVAKSSTAGGNYTTRGPSGGGSGIPGTLTSDVALTSLGYFTLGSTTTDNSLPVSLTSFTANAEFSKITLNWQTESEIDNQGFNIYRASATNPDNWETLNQELIPGAGNTSAKTEYVFVDQLVQSGETYYYQLESISYNGVRELFVESTVTVLAPIPSEFALLNNYPNPFNPVTNIKFQLPDQSEVTVVVYDVQGNLVKKLLSKSIYSAGEHVTQWDATDQFGSKVSSGIYFYQFVAGNFQKYGKMMLIK